MIKEIKNGFPEKETTYYNFKTDVLFNIAVTHQQH